MLKITAIATLALAFAGAASAATPLTAVLTAPTDKPVNLVVDGTAWVCAGPACAAKTFGPGRRVVDRLQGPGEGGRPGQRLCRPRRREAGEVQRVRQEVSYFGAGGRP